MRAQFDRYLDAADGQVKAFNAALRALHAYTSECSTNFAGIKDAFAVSARAERQTHAVLKEVWTTVLPLVGVLTAKIEDKADLLLFAQADVRAVDFSESFGFNTSVGHQFCTEREKQMEVTFRHLVMLEDRFIFSGLGKAPNSEALSEAAKQLKVSKESVDAAIPELAEGLVKKLIGFCQ